VYGVRGAPSAPTKSKPHAAHHEIKGLPEDENATSSTAGPSVNAVLIEDIDTGTFLVELEFTAVDGTRRSCRIPRGDLRSPADVEKLLLNKGARLPSSARLVLKALENGLSQVTQKVTARTGWHGDNFVLPRATLGSDPALTFHPPDNQSTRGLTKGTLAEWRRGIRRALKSSSYLTFVMGVNFAAPLAARVDLEETAVVHTSGESGAGKTLLQKVAVSTVGRAKEKDLVSFNQTKVGSEDVMAAWNGTLIAMNEMKTAEATNDLKSYRVTLAHVLTSGVGRNRSNYSKRDPDLALKTWTAFGITNKEQSLESMASGEREMGERARYIDVVVPPVKKGGIFDRLGDSEESVPNVARTLAKRLTVTIENNYGVAFPPFINYVVGNPAAVLSQFVIEGEKFAHKYAPGDNWERRFAMKFGVGAAGALAAVRAGILPCSEKHVIRSVLKVYREARALFVRSSAPGTNALNKLLGAIGDDRLFPRVERSARVPKNFATVLGFRRTYPTLGDCLAISSNRLRTLAGTEKAFNGLLAELKRRGAHVRGKDKLGLTTICELRGGGRRRYILLRVEVLRKMKKESIAKSRSR
jgi:hypothetical protein